MRVFTAAWDRGYDSLIYVAQERSRHIRGWPELERYLAIVEGAFDRVTAMTIDDLSIDVLGDVAYAFFTYHFEAETPGGDEPFVVDGRDTLILRRTGGAWRIIHYHGSPPGPF
jgi:ketosteroid isomerase-like protein